MPDWLLDKQNNPRHGWITAEYSMLPASTSSRVQREISRGKKIKPYLRNKYFNRITSILWDSEHLCIFLFLFPNFIDVKILIEVFFALSFLASSFSIILYTILSKKYFSNVSNQLDNRE